MNKETSAAPGVRERVNRAGEERAHHTLTKAAPQVRKRPGIGQPLVKTAEPGKVERRLPRAGNSKLETPNSKPIADSQ